MRIWICFSVFNLLDELRKVENVCIYKKKKLIEKSIRLLNILNIKERKDHKPSQLSGGEQQSLSFWLYKQTFYITYELAQGNWTQKLKNNT